MVLEVTTLHVFISCSLVASSFFAARRGEEELKKSNKATKARSTTNFLRPHIGKKNPLWKTELKARTRNIQTNDLHVREVHLSAHEIGFDETLKAVSENSQVKSVSISGRAGKEISFQCISTTCDLIRENSTLEDLRLYYLPCDHSSVFFHTLETRNSALKSLLFSPNREIDDDEARQLCRILHFHPALRSLTVSCKTPALRLLKLQSSFLKTLELYVLDMTVLRAFKAPRALEHLKLLLKGRSFSERRNADSFHSFFKRFHHMQSLRSLKLTLFGFGLDHDVCEPIRQALLNHGNIKSFTLLWSSHCFHPGLESLAPFINTLHIARLSYIADDPMLAKTLAKCSKLQTLQLIDVQISDEAFSLICTAVTQHPHLECINLQQVTFTDGICNSLIELVKTNKRIVTVEGIQGGCMPENRRQELSYYLKLNHIRLDQLLMDKLPISLWSNLLSDLGQDGWHDVMYKLLLEKNDVLIQPGSHQQGPRQQKKKTREFRLRKKKETQAIAPKL